MNEKNVGGFGKNQLKNEKKCHFTLYVKIFHPFAFKYEGYCIKNVNFVVHTMKP